MAPPARPTEDQPRKSTRSRRRPEKGREKPYGDPGTVTPILHPLFLCLVLSFSFNPLRSIPPPHSLLRALSSRCSRNLSPRLASILSRLCPLGPSHFRSLRPSSPFPASYGRISLAISLRARDIFPLKAPENSSASAVPFSNLSRMALRDPAVDSHPFSRCTASVLPALYTNARHAPPSRTSGAIFIPP